jgi:hypothetical protein
VKHRPPDPDTPTAAPHDEEAASASSPRSAGAIALWCTGAVFLLIVIAGIVTRESYVQYVFDNTLPAIGFFLLGLLGLLMLHEKDDPWSGAARPMIESACWALALLSLLLLVFNTWVMPRDDATDVIRNVEVWLIRITAALKTWTTLSTALAIAILLALLLVSRYRPDLKAVSRFAAGRKQIGRVTSALAMATSFSFFTGQAIVTDAGARATEHATVVWRGAKEREDHAVAQHLAARSVEQAVASDPTKVTQHFVAAARAVSEMPELSETQRERLLDYSSWKDATGATEYDAHWRTNAASVEAPIPAKLLENPRAVIDDQVRSATVSEARANAEVKRAVNEVLKVALSAATKPYIENVSTFVEHFVEHHALALHEMVLKYGEKVADGRIDKAAEPLLERATSFVSQRLEADAAPARDLVQLRAGDAERTARLTRPPAGFARGSVEGEERTSVREGVREPVHVPPRPVPMRHGR